MENVPQKAPFFMIMHPFSHFFQEFMRAYGFIVYLCRQKDIINRIMGISVDSIWSQAQRLTSSERMALIRRLRESVSESEAARRDRVASEIDRFFGGWSDDPRTTEEITEQIRAGRTANTYPAF